MTCPHCGAGIASLYFERKPDMVGCRTCGWTDFLNVGKHPPPQRRNRGGQRENPELASTGNPSSRSPGELTWSERMAI